MWLAFGFLPVLVLFTLTALSDSFASALSVVTESESPYCLGRNCTSGGIEADLLAIGGYLLVPVVIGTVAAVVFDHQRRTNYLTEEEFERRLEEQLRDLPPKT
jgi:hypothetical protein